MWPCDKFTTYIKTTWLLCLFARKTSLQCSGLQKIYPRLSKTVFKLKSTNHFAVCRIEHILNNINFLILSHFRCISETFLFQFITNKQHSWFIIFPFRYQSRSTKFCLLSFFFLKTPTNNWTMEKPT